MEQTLMSMLSILPKSMVHTVSEIVGEASKLNAEISEFVAGEHCGKFNLTKNVRQQFVASAFVAMREVLNQNIAVNESRVHDQDKFNDYVDDVIKITCKCIDASILYSGICRADKAIIDDVSDIGNTVQLWVHHAFDLVENMFVMVNAETGASILFRHGDLEHKFVWSEMTHEIIVDHYSETTSAYMNSEDFVKQIISVVDENIDTTLNNESIDIYGFECSTYNESDRLLVLGHLHKIYLDLMLDAEQSKKDYELQVSSYEFDDECAKALISMLIDKNIVKIFWNIIGKLV